MADKLKVTLVKSPIGCVPKHRRTVEALGLKKVNKTVELPDNAAAVSYTHLGNYALGIKEQLIFPEIEYDKVDKVRGMDIIFVTTANTDEEARELLTLFNMPFAK